jgi:ribosome biogenesis GTPase / thiamine phosphate phosphatase
MLLSGVMVIDTPGLRELGMWDVDTGLGEAFNDVEQYFGRCRFSDCGHRSEPGCALKQAIAIGELPRERWDSYLQLKREAKFAEDKAGYLRAKQERYKKLRL